MAQDHMNLREKFKSLQEVQGLMGFLEKHLQAPFNEFKFILEEAPSFLYLGNLDKVIT